MSADGKRLASHARSALLVALADKVGLTDAFAEALAPSRERRCAHDPGEVVRDLCAMLADGALVAGTAAGLEVHSPYDAAPRARVVVLDELVRDAELRPLLATVGLREEAPLVAEDLRLDEDGSLEAGVEPLGHGDRDCRSVALLPLRLDRRRPSARLPR